MQAASSDRHVQERQRPQRHAAPLCVQGNRHEPQVTRQEHCYGELPGQRWGGGGGGRVGGQVVVVGRSRTCQGTRGGGGGEGGCAEGQGGHGLKGALGD
jgi:hypothetical protein